MLSDVVVYADMIHASCLPAYLQLHIARLISIILHDCLFIDMLQVRIVRSIACLLHVEV
jgi:hypothetical protein